MLVIAPRVSTKATYIGEIGGAADDYARSLGIAFSYTIELPPEDNDPREFILPDYEIIPAGLEASAGILQLAYHIA